MILSKERIAGVPVRLRGSAACLLFARNRIRVSRDEARRGTNFVQHDKGPLFQYCSNTGLKHGTVVSRFFNCSFIGKRMRCHINIGGKFFEQILPFTKI